MLIVRLAGGLGNQIFQIAAALIIAEKQQINKVIIDDSALNSYEVKRKNELSYFFNFDKSSIPILESSFYITKLRIPVHSAYLYSFWPFVSDRNFQFVLNSNKPFFRLLDGYFQECLTQDNFDEEIELLKKVFIKNEIEKKDGCVIHIRGGDFVKLGWNSVTPKEYYINALHYMRQNYGVEKFYIVTDDREYSNSILQKLEFDYEFIGHSMYEDFYLIGSFKYRILSSSTFALWASALGDNDDSVVIAPEFWTPNHERNIFLPNEMRIVF